MATWFRLLRKRVQRSHSADRPRRPRHLNVEWLEDRCIPAGFYLQTNLVSDVPGLAHVTDPNLLNPWGIASSAASPFWVSDNGAGVSTLYNGAGQPVPLIVTIPPPMGGMPPSAPTGVVFNGSGDFVVAQGGNMGPAVFLFATEDGTIAGWNPTVDATNAVLAVDNSAGGAVYKGLALGSTATGSFIYAANFNSGQVDVFDTNFAPVALGAGAFTDSNLPPGFAPFDIANIGGNLFVTYALQDDAKHDDVAGPGNGFIDVFDTSGTLLRRFASNGTLNSPWGMAVAPSNFGDFSNDLLVGNFGDGRISAFDPATGNLLGQLKDRNETPIQIQGLWGLRFGNGAAAGPSNTLFFTAGLNGERDGIFGSLQSQIPSLAAGTDAGGAPEVKLIDAASGQVRFDFLAYSPAFSGGVRVAVGDVNGDGYPDLITVPGPGLAPEVKVFSGKNGALLMDFFAYGVSFTGGVFVAAGDINGDGAADIITGTDAGAAPEVKAFGGGRLSGQQLRNFFAFGPSATGGVRVAAGDVEGNGFADIIAAQGPGGPPEVRVFSSLSGMVVMDFMAFDPRFLGGVYVAAGDVNGDGKADIITGAGQGGVPLVRVFSGKDGTVLQSFFPFNPLFAGGVRVGAADLNGTGRSAVVVGAGPLGATELKAFDTVSLAILDDFFAFNPLLPSGVFVAAGR